jgi:hypothetical protein
MVQKRDKSDGFKNDHSVTSSGRQPAQSLEKLSASSLPRATHTGELKIGDLTIECAVLEDGTRVLTQRDFMQVIGRMGRPRKRTELDGDGRPAFLIAANLEQFIGSDLRKAWNPILFRPKGSGNTAYGYRAELLPQVCNVYLDAADSGQLQPNQMGIAAQCKLLVRGFATVGIVALVDEATGYQEARDRDALHQILEAYIAKELLPWTKRFPDEFYKELFRLRGWQFSPMSPRKGPRFAGKLTNEIVYKRLPPGVLEELQEKNPKVGDGQRKYRHHQLLTLDIGNPHLEKHLSAVLALMRASATWGGFKRLFERAFPNPNQPHQPELMPAEDWDDTESE